MTSGHESTLAAPDETVQATAADAVTDPAMGMMGDAADGQRETKQQRQEPSAKRQSRSSATLRDDRKSKSDGRLTFRLDRHRRQFRDRALLHFAM